MVGKPTVLCVDDEEIQLHVLEKILSLDYEVTLCEKAEEALGLLADYKEFDVLLTDFLMPGMDGVELCREFEARSPNTARLLMTFHVEPEQADALTNMGQLATFIMKPIFPEKLLRIIEEKLGIYD